VIVRTAASRVAEALERQGPRSFVSTAAASVWKHSANPVRCVALPRHARVVGVGGPTLGGSYKTPFVIALARALADREHRVAVVAHGYGARAKAARRVRISDDVRDVGDDALCLEEALRHVDVPIFVGRRDDALALAAAESRVVIVDGLLQAAPRRLDWSILVADAKAPWGAGWCPPAGDLRASRAALLSATDDIALVVDSSSTPEVDPEEALSTNRSFFRMESRLETARGPAAEVIPLTALRASRVGLLAAIARPDRVVAALAARGVLPSEVRLFRDHARLPERSSYRRGSGVDVWVTTKKCWTKLCDRYEGSPVFRLEHELGLPPELVQRAENRVAG
jgi:tetraacyldisaccharide 4'-kinase